MSLLESENKGIIVAKVRKKGWNITRHSSLCLTCYSVSCLHSTDNKALAFSTIFTSTPGENTTYIQMYKNK